MWSAIAAKNRWLETLIDFKRGDLCSGLCFNVFIIAKIVLFAWQNGTNASFFFFFLVSYVGERSWWPIQCLKKGRRKEGSESWACRKGFEGRFVIGMASSQKIRIQA